MKPIRDIFAYTRGLKRYMLIIAVLAVVSALLAFATPYIVKFATDWVASIIIDHQQFSWGPPVLFGSLMVMAAIVSALVSDIGGFFGDQLAIRTRHQLSTAYYKHLLSLPQSYYDNELTGKIINRLNRAISDITNFLQFFSNTPQAFAVRIFWTYYISIFLF